MTRHRDRRAAQGVPALAGQDDDRGRRARPRVPEGGVFGFLGPNGSGQDDDDPLPARAGATDRGDGATILGQATPHAPRHGDAADRCDRRDARVVPDDDRPREPAPARCDRPHPGRRASTTMLELVGLAERGDDKVRRYSLGMRQRLGLAAALLKDPALLVLDEPANGLDPAGIREIRELLRRSAPKGAPCSCRATCSPRSSRPATASRSSTAGKLVLEGRVDDVLAAAARAVGAGRARRSRQPGRGCCRPRVSTSSRSACIAARVGSRRARPRRVTKLLADYGLYVTELRADDDVTSRSCSSR